MFKKLLSNLPFNPSLIGQVGFYVNRLRAETSIRRIGAAFLVLSLMVQLFAVVVPSRSTLARSGNDIIPGGFSSQGQAVNHCNNNDNNFRVILQNFGVDCLALYFGSVKTINSRDYSSQLYSMGRAPYGLTGEVSVNVPGAGTFFMRPLWAWDSGASSSYQAITGTRSDGTPFMVLFDCGNLVIVGAPMPPPPPPPPPPPIGVECTNLLMSVANKSEVKVGTTINVRGQATGKNLRPNEQVSMYYQYVDAKTGRVLDEKNAEGLKFRGTLVQDSITRPFKVDKEGKYIFRLTVKYDGGSKEAAGSRVGNCKKEITVTKEKPCITAKDDDDATVCLVLSKKARNDTQNVADANGVTANASDTITYTLSVTNTSTNTPLKKFVVEENITDLLEYADVVNLHGGVLDAQNVVRWPATNIQPGKTIEKKLTVKVKGAIPQTPASSSNPGSFDCIMTNVYGDTVNIPLDCSVIKATEQLTGSIPNTGPGETLAVAVTLTVVAGYFLARSRLITKELEIVREDYTTSGGA